MKTTKPEPKTGRIDSKTSVLKLDKQISQQSTATESTVNTDKDTSAMSPGLAVPYGLNNIKPVKKVKKPYEKPWFLPVLRSKFLTIELLKIMYEYRY